VSAVTSKPAINAKGFFANRIRNIPKITGEIRTGAANIGRHLLETRGGPFNLWRNWKAEGFNSLPIPGGLKYRPKFSAPKSVSYLVSDKRISRYESKINTLLQAGYGGERLAELQGRIDMLKLGYIRTRGTKLTGTIARPGMGRGQKGIDQLFKHICDPTDLAILESKWSSKFVMGKDPTSTPTTKF